MNDSNKDNTARLIEMIYQLIDIIRYENLYAYHLLKQITCNKRTMIELDGCSIYLEATCDMDDYRLMALPGNEQAPTQFITTSYTLRRVMAGIITLDHAVVKNEIYVQGVFDDIMNMHKLTSCFLSEGPLNFSLQHLWHHFNNNWNNNNFPLTIAPLESQKPEHGFLLNHIPEKVLLIKV